MGLPARRADLDRDPRAVGMRWVLFAHELVGYIIPDLEKEYSNLIDESYQSQ